jgi:isopentenyl diphosphate isomerase/L-lactate dehydrogenase-like FMN-dependent dehydrogenase
MMQLIGEIDCSGSLFDKKLRIPVLLAPIGSLESLESGGGATFAKGQPNLANAQF